MSLTEALREAGYRVAFDAPEGRDGETVEALCRLFAGRPPDLLLADLSTTTDCLPLRHVRRLLRHAWGDDTPGPPCLALFTLRHLDAPDWPAFTDDFLLPPYAPAEVLARVTMLLFRQRHVRTDDTIRFADVIVDLAGGGARQDGSDSPLPLTPREFDLLRFLVTHRGKFFARDRLLDMVWGVDFDGGERTVDIHIRRLRAKLPPQTAARLETRRGIGYGLSLPD